MPRIRIDAGELLMAMEDHGGYATSYLDRQTGEILRISEYDDEREELQDKIEADESRYLYIEPIPSQESFEVMEDFIASVSDEEAKSTLEQAISRRRPFRNFKDAFYDFPQVREEWFRFHNEMLLQKAKEWVEVEGIDAELVDNIGAPDDSE